MTIREPDWRLLGDVVKRRCPRLLPLVEAARVGQVDPEVREAMRDALTVELAEGGFNEHYEPTQYGLALEGLIDVLGKPRVL